METPTLDYSKEVKTEKLNKDDKTLTGNMEQQEELPKERRNKIKAGQTKAEYYKEQAKYYRKESEYYDAKFELEQYSNRKKSLKMEIFVVFIGLIVSLGCYLLFSKSLATQPLLLLLIIFLHCAMFLMICYMTWQEMRQEEKHNKQIILEYELSHAQEEVEEDPFQNSIKTSYKYLDRYYDQTQRQAQQGFRITVFIAVCGAALIFGGVAAMYAGFIQPAYITCASGAITELISAIFFYLYNKTVTSMSRYHNKLVLSQNISFALRVADSLSEEKKDDAKLAIINELVKDVNAQMMKSDADTDEPPKEDKPSDNETPS